MGLKIRNEIKIDNQIFLLLVALTILLVLSGIVNSLIVPPGVEILIEEVFFYLFLSISMGFFAGGFIIQAFAEQNTLNKILCFGSGALIAIAAIFGTMIAYYAYMGLLGAIIIVEIAILLSLIFLFVSLGIYALRRA